MPKGITTKDDRSRVFDRPSKEPPFLCRTVCPGSRLFSTESTQQPETLNQKNLQHLNSKSETPSPKPRNGVLEDEFIAKYGDCEELDSADFDFVSKARQRAKGGKDGDLMCQYKVTTS